MKLHTISPVAMGQLDVAVTSMRGLEPAKLEKLGAQLLADAIGYPNIPLSRTAKNLATVSAQLSWPQRDQLLRGFFGTSSAAADQPAIGVFEAKLASAAIGSGGSWVCELKPGAELSDQDRRALRARFAGQDVAFFAGPPAPASRHGATPAKALTKPKKEALLAELQSRFDGVKDLVVRDGVLQISVGPEFDRFSREPLGRAIDKFGGGVSFETVFDGKGAKPALELSASGQFTAWVDGKARVPLLQSREESAAAVAQVGDPRVIDLYTSTDRRSLTVRLEPWVTAKDAAQALNKVSKKLGADALRAVVDSGVAYTVGDAPAAHKVWSMSDGEAQRALAAVRRIDPHVTSVGLAMVTPDHRLQSSGGSSGNAVSLVVDAGFDMNKADVVFAAAQKALGVDETVPMRLARLYAAELATKGITPPKDAYRGLRDGDT